MTNAGGYEVNPLFRSQSGQLSYGRMITIKSLTCVVPIVISEALYRRHPENAEYAGTAGSAVLAGFYSWAAVHNYSLTKQMNQPRPVPAYLK